LIFIEARNVHAVNKKDTDNEANSTKTWKKINTYKHKNNRLKADDYYNILTFAVSIVT